MLRIVAFLMSLLITCSAYSAKEKKDSDSEYSKFGFGPAFYMISYNDEVLQDSKDVRLRGDGKIDASGSEYGTALGLEVHYDFDLYRPYCNGAGRDSEGKQTCQSSSGSNLSPFVGIYDVENGIKGLAIGAVYGFWRGDGNFENRKALNIGLGYTIHREQLVLGNGLKENTAPPATLKVEDYTTRKDVSGYIAMVSITTTF